MKHVLVVNDGGDCEEAIELLFRCGGLEYWF